MAGEKKIEKHESVIAEQKSDPSAKPALQDVDSRQDGTPPNSTSSISSSGNATFSVKGETDRESVSEHGASHPPISCYNYYYPGYNGTSSHVDDLTYSNSGDASHTGTQADNTSLLYYMPGYNPCFSPSGYLQQPGTFGSETMPCYSWDPTYGRDVTNGTSAVPRNSKSTQNTNYAVKSNGFNRVTDNNTLATKDSTSPLDSRSHFSKPNLQSGRTKPLKTGYGYPTDSPNKGFHPVGSFSPFTDQSRGLFGHYSQVSYGSNGYSPINYGSNGYAQINYGSNGRMWNDNYRYNLREKSNRSGNHEASTELTRGPRVNSGRNPTNSSLEEEQRASKAQKDQCNLEDFQTDYENAKFFVIKSYSEDDIHKCVKYDVWSSTPNGNKKLDSAFQDAEAKARETGKKCPVFLFFSVNGSGQFVGVAEMIGKVDFNKDMDFWQQDKWSGFFPVKWHIIKDVPHARLRHITLENNENKPVTFTRDAQEVWLKQGLEMLSIFKSFSGKTSILDDFDFYENREKLLKTRRSNKPSSPETEVYKNGDHPVKQAGESKIVEGKPARLDPPTSLINNLSLD